MKMRWLPAILLLCPVSLSAQSVTRPAGFAEAPTHTLTVAAFSDADVTGFLRTLDALLAAPQDPARPGSDAGIVFGNFARRIQQGRLTRAQETRVLAHLTEIGRASPQHAAFIQRSQFVIASLMVGKTAPEIVGRDLDGAPLKLTDHRGKVVVVVFSAEWCGICRTLYPYERLMLELYERWPFALLGVETGSSPDATKRYRTGEGLTYRAWWDAPGDGDKGPIATAWRVSGLPAVYILDGRGVIRFIDLRQEDLLKGVRQLLTEQTASPSRPIARSAP